MISLSQAILGYQLDARARRLSPHTLADYQNSFRKFQDYIAVNPVNPAHPVPDPDLAAITPDHVRGFLASLATAAPIVNGRVRTIGKKQTLNIHTGLSALWTWALREGYATRHILHDIQRPRPEKPAIIPYSQDDIKRLLTACDQTKTYQRAGQRIQERTRGTALRDRCLILVLLDTGVRASELCGLRIIDADLRNQRITVTGKGSKTRMIPIGPSTAKLIFRYLSAERRDVAVNEPLFVANDRQLNRDALVHLLARLGERAGVTDVHPHRFRHTFAVLFLRNGGNTRALQDLLGHETLDMIKTYTRLAEADLAIAHRQASPVENWRLG